MSAGVDMAGGLRTAGSSMPGLEFLRTMAQSGLHWLVAIWIFAGGFVFMEPSPYEVMFLLVLPVALMTRVGVYRHTLKLFMLLVAFVPFALIAVFQVKYSEVSDALIYTLVTVFLMLTSYFVANYVADAPFERTRVIMRGYLAAGLLTAALGILAYLGLMPGRDLFLLYGRAKATFQDPNVFGPFLMLPAMFVLQRVLLGSQFRAVWGAVLFGILFVGVFVTFSRAAWGYILISAVITFFLNFVLEADGRQKVRMLILALSGTVLMVISLAGLLSIPAVADLFATRASFEQSYDTGDTGRFGRQGYAFELALENPLGLGPREFNKLRITEQPHNTYVNVLHAYGWGGGLVYWALVLMTLWRGLKALGVKSPNRLLIIPLIATYIPLVAESVIIDTDHWRHYFLIVGMIWGVTGGYWRVSPLQKREGRPALI